MNQSRWLAVALVLAVSGCSTPTQQWQWDSYSAKGLNHLRIENGETIAVVLKSSTGPDGPQAVNKQVQRAIENCIKDGLREVKSRLVLSDLDHPRLRYRVDVGVVTSLSSEQKVGGGVAGRSRNQETTFYGDVFDVKENRLLARIGAASEGEKVWAVGFYIIIPIPFSGSPPTETAACRAFADLLDRRFADSANPRTPREDRIPSEPLVNCVANGERQWTYRSKCD